MKKVDREERGDVFTTQPWLGSQQMNGTGLAGLGTGRGGEGRDVHHNHGLDLGRALATTL
jgi:hypothetical protein